MLFVGLFVCEGLLVAFYFVIAFGCVWRDPVMLDVVFG